MWWYIKKHSDTANSIKYLYGFQTKETTGVISFNKENGEITIERIADNDSEMIVNRFLVNHIHAVIRNEDAPNERLIAIS